MTKPSMTQENPEGLAGENVSLSAIVIDFFLNLFFYYCSNTVVSIFPQPYPPLALSKGPLYMFFDDPFPSFPCYFHHPTPLWLLSVCS